MTCKILALVDSLGNLIKFRLMPGQYHDLVETKPLIEDVDFQALGIAPNLPALYALKKDSSFLMSKSAMETITLQLPSPVLYSNEKCLCH